MHSRALTCSPLLQAEQWHYTVPCRLVTLESLKTTCPDFWRGYYVVQKHNATHVYRAEASKLKLVRRCSTLLESFSAEALLRCLMLVPQRAAGVNSLPGTTVLQCISIRGTDLDCRLKWPAA